MKNTSANRVLYKLSLMALAVTALSACTNQPKVNQQTQTELAGAQQCIAQHQAHAEQVTQQQGQILTQLQQMQTQLAAQQKALDSRPQVVERPAPKVDCPAPVAEAAKKGGPREQLQTDKQIVGLREQALIGGLNVVMNARISTNVANSVIDARNIQMFERNGEEWVRFTIYNPDTKEPHVLERKRLRFQTVQSANPTPDRRPVVEIRFTIGKLSQKGEFILADRSSSEYPILIGRNLLRDVMLVDVSGNNLAPLQRNDAAAKNDTTAKN
ncbi:hypothetical protein D0C16_16585 [Cellvibrio sp. KY-GH-1]|uniref:ATP-dependent zinc protease family protein n=1 Tax=Cellvibrio sp. KY-GH-1 TaxID=2303332 RepID=UPI00124783C1|nr:RimK/LysX family protein [Cellvibrio sp. KY-GH-1]QEY17455.1 hypothetical protein D0C16_16585 [Cellvibrio sp. KY-GH-1]